MKDQIIKTSCWGVQDQSTSLVEKRDLCPLCNGLGVEVKNITVKSLVKDELVDGVGQSNYFVCMNDECDVVYFNPYSDMFYNKDQIKVPIWFKKDADPRYICYCNQVTEDQIIRAVINDGAKDMKDIIRLTGAMKNGKCERENPLGKCCGPIIQETINKALKLWVAYRPSN